MIKKWAPTLIVTAATIVAWVVYLQPSHSQARGQAGTDTVEARRLAN